MTPYDLPTLRLVRDLAERLRTPAPVEVPPEPVAGAGPGVWPGATCAVPSPEPAPEPQPDEDVSNTPPAPDLATDDHRTPGIHVPTRERGTCPVCVGADRELRPFRQGMVCRDCYSLLANR